MSGEKDLHDVSEIKVPLNQWVREVAREVAREVTTLLMQEFNRTREETCPVGNKLETKVHRLDIKFYVLVGFLSGLGGLNLWTLLR